MRASWAAPRLDALARSAASALCTAYLKLVIATTRFRPPPAGRDAAAEIEEPCIVAMWHGQQLLAPAARRGGRRVKVLVSSHRDGALVGAVVRRLGLGVIRGSGAHDRQQARRKGGMAAFRQMLRALAAGESVALTADVPKTARRAGLGIVLLAKHSGRPIHPLAVVSNRRIDLDNWDRTSIPLPFGRGAIVVGQPIHVPPDAGDEALEQARRAVERGLDATIARAYAAVGDRDPGAVRDMSAPAPAQVVTDPMGTGSIHPSFGSRAPMANRAFRHGRPGRATAARIAGLIAGIAAAAVAVAAIALAEFRLQDEMEKGWRIIRASDDALPAGRP
ncbi:lysophospholipid acyltransferase family protein [Chelatococcus sp. SYSU_G07232]|uniref:Lysophospholipid acyltransferase family protein n=1 Tax=Chelatococcus albus TaxID=3047466 RepID=A0ABT7AKR2_9HYPH|nr:lysophospholipid acyltransferase family protein [Chelatococcus sp. SYSU_G07232]MDJ1159963.1 lysophospholipid acyltransferase family protein [Chelatococcus sp. SYSU_G07232]